MTRVTPVNFAQHPTWDNAIKTLFTKPYWIDEDKQEQVADGWNGCMKGYAIPLQDYDSVRQWAELIYDYLYSRVMPLTDDLTQLWPDEAVEQLRQWVNEGCRRNDQDPLQSLNRIPPPSQRPARLRRRRNILDLSDEELNAYRMKLENLDIDSIYPNARWQQIAAIHTDWCLHYQEAFLLWHRANLLYFEELIDFPIPYWDFMSPNVIKDGTPEAGLPQPFKDLTYVHPQTGEVRANPLRFAAARGGHSKACVKQANDALAGLDCKYIQRDPILYTEGDDRREERQQKLNLVAKFQQQVVLALQWPQFSTPEGSPGYPWANIQSFNPPPPDSDYPHRCDFDGLYEQPHDNFHGWIGPDMADNTYTAYDPIFWSYHANIDRIFESWKRAHPAATFTVGFALRPFVGPLAKKVAFADRRSFIFTSLGDMAKDSRSLGYDYLPAYQLPGDNHLLTPKSSAPLNHLYIIFEGVRCIFDTYIIDVFLNLPEPQPADIRNQSSHYVGRFTRLGMGIEDDKGRCIKNGVTRILDATDNAQLLQLTPESAVSLSLIVTDVTTGQELTPAEYQPLPGFIPIYRWGEAIPVPSWLRASNQSEASSCHCTK